MNDAMPDRTNDPPREHCCFGLIVTGKGEREFLPALFSVLAEWSSCSFKVVRKADQRGPLSTKRRLKMVGRGSVIPDKDEIELGLPARHFLRESPCRFLIVIDDVEYDRRNDLPAIWERYRTAIDTMLQPDEKIRASVHFFANMLKAYYFADSKAVNAALKLELIESDFDGDVEEIIHPKHELEEAAASLKSSFNERRDGAKIVPMLNLRHILSRSDTCPYLRSLFAWCVRHLLARCPVWDPSIEQAFALGDGIQADLTRSQ